MDIPTTRAPSVPANTTTDIQDVGIAEFEATVVNASMSKPVIVDFWAPWCEPCKQLMPLLEAEVKAVNGSVSLAKVNIDENQQLASMMQVQSVPTVLAFYKGQPVDGFMGAQPQSAIKAFVNKLAAMDGNNETESLAEEIQKLLNGAYEYIEQEEWEIALAAYTQILEMDPENIDTNSSLALCLIKTGDFESARSILDKLPKESENNNLYKSAKAALEVAEQSSDLPDIKNLQAKLKKNENDHQSRFEMAMVLFQSGEEENAMDEMIKIIKSDRKWNDEAARKQLVSFFEALGPTHELTLSGRRKLSSVLFS